ncbi:MAG: twin-arginine translocation pathway signal protein [Burkholderiales bacterium]|nr:MAG: twin-arginine translocation pathway signal protein [Burkholderiales bacterium]TAG78766.1 MAG: twin-arginine translocation pathway signal protein [Betaproteobacteria bacterium]
MLGGAAALPWLATAGETFAQTLPQTPAQLSDAALRQRAFDIRTATARSNLAIPIPPHPDNGDEQRYPNRIGSDSRGLPHNARGEVDLNAYSVLTAAYDSGDPDAFERIPLGGTRKFLNPIGSFAVSLVGPDVTQFAIPPAPALASTARASEAIELYWQSLLRDVPLSEYRDDTSHPLIRAAVDELNKVTDFNGPKVGGRVTPQTLFRGNAWYVDRADTSGRSGRWVTPPGVTDGPVVSQFLLRDAPFSTQFISARIRAYQPIDFLTEYDEWLRVQNGQPAARPVQFESANRFIATGRDLAVYAHLAPSLSWSAAQLLATPAFPPNPSYGGLFPANVATTNLSNPYRNSKTQAGGASSFAQPYFQWLIAQGTPRAIRAAYFQKFRYHRTLRPEAYAGLIHHRIASNVRDYPVHESVLGSAALARSREKFGSHLLSHVYPEGAPIHSSYPSGASIIGAVGATLLKAFFDESLVIPSPLQADPNDPTRTIAYAGTPLTVGGELNKLALNYGTGRSWAGIHWRSDVAAALSLGEDIAIGLLRDERATFRESFAGFSFTKFDGTKITI